MDTGLMPIPMQSQVKTRVGKNVTAMAQWAQRDEKISESILFIFIKILQQPSLLDVFLTNLRTNFRTHLILTEGEK